MPTYDLFISHAREDKAAFVEPLVQALEDRGLKVWYDAWEIRLGDDFRRKMDEGLAGCRFGVVVLSPSYGRYWTEAELSALMNQERVFGSKRILPIKKTFPTKRPHAGGLCWRPVQKSAAKMGSPPWWTPSPMPLMMRPPHPRPPGLLPTMYLALRARCSWAA